MSYENIGFIAAAKNVDEAQNHAQDLITRFVDEININIRFDGGNILKTLSMNSQEAKDEVAALLSATYEHFVSNINVLKSCLNEDPNTLWGSMESNYRFRKACMDIGNYAGPTLLLYGAGDGGFYTLWTQADVDRFCEDQADNEPLYLVMAEMCY